MIKITDLLTLSTKEIDKLSKEDIVAMLNESMQYIVFTDAGKLLIKSANGRRK